METIEKTLKRIIPPPTREDREGFTNDHIISKLKIGELKIVEERLIDMLQMDNDYLIAETLIKLDSINAILPMENWLKKANSPSDKIKWASFINEIKKGDKEMENIAFKTFEKFEFKYGIESILFDDLIKFNSPRINDLIKQFVDHKYFLVSHHAKRVLNLKSEKKWWQIWK